MRKSIASKVPTAHPSAGLDLGCESSQACILDEKGSVLLNESVQTTPEGLRQFFEGRPRMFVLMEACGVTGWIARLLAEMGHEVLVCNPRRLRMIAESTLKTDKLDAYVIAMMARIAQVTPDMVQPVTVRSRQTQLWRSVLGQREQLVKARTSCLTSVKSLLRSDAIKLPKADAENFGARVAAMDLPDDVREAVTPMLAVLKTLSEQIFELEKKISSLHEDMPITRAFRAIDGVGLLVSTAFALTIEDPSRFERPRDVGAYLGLTPSIRQSSTIERRGRSTKQGDERLRRYLVQAALILMRSKHPSALQAWGRAVEQRAGKKKACVAVARKLAVVMLSMWKNSTPYERFPTWEARAAA